MDPQHCRVVFQNLWRRPFKKKRGSAELEAASERDVAVWSHLFQTIVSLVRQLYTRDTRRQFCPTNHWISPRVELPLDRPQDISFGRLTRRFFLVLWIRDVYPGSRVVIFTHPGSRISDPGSKNSYKRKRWKIICCHCHTFFCSHKFHKI